jgi:hypothetical protein
MTMTALPDQSPQQADVAPVMLDLVADIEHLVTKACGLRQRVLHDPDKQLTSHALADMIHLLAEVKLRLRVDASGNHLR